MISIPTTDLTDQECEKGQLTQRPPIPYAISKAETILKASRETVKMKSPEGEVKMAVLGDSPGPEEYLQHHNAFLQMLARKKWDDELTRLTKAAVTAAALVRKLVKIPNEETEPETSQRITRWEAAEAELSKAQAHESAKVGLVYDLFRKTKRRSRTTVGSHRRDMHAKDPWEGLRGAKHDGLRRKSMASLSECIDFHKLTVYSIDAADRQRFYMSCNLKKPDGLKIQVRLCHVLRKDPTISYVEYLTNLSNESWTRARGRYLEADLLRDPGELRI